MFIYSEVYCSSLLYLGSPISAFWIVYRMQFEKFSKTLPSELNKIMKR